MDTKFFVSLRCRSLACGFLFRWSFGSFSCQSGSRFRRRRSLLSGWRWSRLGSSRRGFSLRRLFRILVLLDQTAHRVRRLRALTDPVFNPLELERAVHAPLFRIVSAYDFDKFPIARTAFVR